MRVVFDDQQARVARVKVGTIVTDVLGRSIGDADDRRLSVSLEMRAPRFAPDR